MTYSAISLPRSDAALIIYGENLHNRSEIDLVSTRLWAHFLSFGGNFATMSEVSLCEFASILIARRDETLGLAFRGR